MDTQERYTLDDFAASLREIGDFMYLHAEISEQTSRFLAAHFSRTSQEEKHRMDDTIS